MTTAPEMPRVEDLRSAKDGTGLSFRQLHERYVTAARAAGLSEREIVGITTFKAYFRGETWPQVPTWFLMLAVLNEQLRSVGRSDLELPMLGVSLRRLPILLAS